MSAAAISDLLISIHGGSRGGAMVGFAGRTMRGLGRGLVSAGFRVGGVWVRALEARDCFADCESVTRLTISGAWPPFGSCGMTPMPSRMSSSSRLKPSASATPDARRCSGVSSSGERRR